MKNYLLLISKTFINAYKKVVKWNKKQKQMSLVDFKNEVFKIAQPVFGDKSVVHVKAELLQHSSGALSIEYSCQIHTDNNITPVLSCWQYSNEKSLTPQDSLRKIRARLDQYLNAKRQEPVDIYILEEKQWDNIPF